jgi:hypothetical protein
MAFSGNITLTGVTAQISTSDTSVFGVMDTNELLACKNLNCGAYTQTVRLMGGQSQPKIGDEVIVTGSFVKYPSGAMVFEVTNIDVTRNVMNLISN